MKGKSLTAYYNKIRVSNTVKLFDFRKNQTLNYYHQTL